MFEYLHHTRYYYLTEAGGLKEQIYYTIGGDRPLFRRDGTIQVFPRRSDNLSELEEGTEGMPLVLTSGTLGISFIEAIYKDRENWETLWIPWQNLKDIVILAAYCAKKKVLLLTVTMGKGAHVEIADNMLHAHRRSAVSYELDSLLRRILGIAPLLFPSEGVVLSR